MGGGKVQAASPGDLEGGGESPGGGERECDRRFLRLLRVEGLSSACGRLYQLLAVPIGLYYTFYSCDAFWCSVIPDSDTDYLSSKTSCVLARPYLYVGTWSVSYVHEDGFPDDGTPVSFTFGFYWATVVSAWFYWFLLALAVQIVSSAEWSFLAERCVAHGDSADLESGDAEPELGQDEQDAVLLVLSSIDGLNQERTFEKIVRNPRVARLCVTTGQVTEKDLRRCRIKSDDRKAIVRAFRLNCGAGGASENAAAEEQDDSAEILAKLESVGTPQFYDVITDTHKTLDQCSRLTDSDLESMGVLLRPMRRAILDVFGTAAIDTARSPEAERYSEINDSLCFPVLVLSDYVEWDSVAARWLARLSAAAVVLSLAAFVFVLPFVPGAPSIVPLEVAVVIIMAPYTACGYILQFVVAPGLVLFMLASCLASFCCP